MKKIKFLGFILLIMFILPNSIMADTVNININCSPKDNVKPGGTSSCLIKGNADINVSKIEINVNSGNFTIDSFSPSTGWTGSIDSNKITLTASDANLTGEFNIGTLNITIAADHADGSETISLTGVVFYDENNNASNASNGETSITIKSESTTIEKGLSTLTVTGGALSPAFTSSNTGYNILLDNASTTTFSISATANNSSDTITYLNGDTDSTIDPTNITFTTATGKSSMLIKINVGTGDNAVTYNIAVTKPTIAEATGELASLTIGGVTVNLESGKHDYVVYLSNVNDYEVNATLKDNTNYEFTSAFPTRMNGETEFPIVVNPKDSSSGLSCVTYIITIKKSRNGSSSSSSQASGNPQTGGAAITMAVVLVISFTASIYLYKKNIEEYN